MIDEQNWYSIPEAARLLDLPRRTVIRWLRSGRLESRRDPEGHLGVSLKDVETLRRDPFSDSSEDIDGSSDPLFEGEWIYDGMNEDTPAAEAPVDEVEPDVLPEDADDVVVEENSPRDPLLALEHQAERSIQAAGAAFHEAKELAVVYRNELQIARQEHREELHRVRRIGRFAWLTVAASVLVILGGALFIGWQFGDQKLYESRVSHLTDRLGRTAVENQNLQDKIETLKNDSAGVASELKSAKLAQADAVGQLAAFRAHAGQLTHRVDVLETQIRKERSLHSQELAEAKKRAVESERKRLSLIRQARAEQAERQRQQIAARARAQREALQRQQQERIQAQQAQQAREEQLCRANMEQIRKQKQDAALAQVDRRTRTYRRQNTTANLTLTELEEALTAKK